jgi:signal transduction histidine kinase
LNRFRVFSHSIRSLDFKVLAVVSLVILAMAVASLLLFKRLADQAQSLLFDAMDAMSFAVHHGLSSQMNERYYDLHAFAKNPAVQSLDPEAIAQVLDDFMQLYQIYDLLLVTDTQGRLVSSNRIGPKGDALNLAPLQARDFSQERWFQVAMTGETFVDDPVLDPYLASMDGRNARTTTFAAPVRDLNDRVRGVIALRAGVRWIQKELDHAYAMFHAGGFSVARLELINAQGIRMAEAGAQIKAQGANERPVRYPGTADRSRAAKIWSLIESDDGDFMSGSSFMQAPPYAPLLGWNLRVTVGASSASRQLADTVRMSYAWILLASLGLLILAVAYIWRLVISRHLQNLVAIRTAELHQTTRDLEKKNQELERHKKELENSNRQLIEAQKELLDTAKRLGQSEVAALTLHNIGNIVTSLNIQSTLLREQMERDAPGQLTLAFLKKCEADSSAIESLKPMITKLETAEAEALAHIQGILRGLIDNVRMAMAAISSQLAFVHQSESPEAYKLSELLHHTLLLYFGTFRRHRVEERMQLRHDAMFMTERFLFESILTVLIRNAIDATEGQSLRQISFATERDDEGLTLIIRDSGHGFDEDVGSRLFRFGFSTKTLGHGFGLHYAANSCRHLGLELKLQSPGKGLGAAASIRIPKDRLLSVVEFVDFAQSRKDKGPDQNDKTGAYAP